MQESHFTELPVKELRWRCNPERLGYDTTESVECCTEIIGQERALKAIRLGLEIGSPGYNIFVSGLTGTGKTTTIRRLLKGMRHGAKTLSDICFVHNFVTPEEPVCLRLEAGEGSKLKKAMGELLVALREHVPKAFDSDRFSKRHKAIVEEFKTRRAELASGLETAIKEKEFQLLEVQYGPFTRPVVVPLVDGNPVEMDQLEKLVAEGKYDKESFERVSKDHEQLSDMMNEFLRSSRGLDRELGDRLDSLARNVVMPIIDGYVDELRARFVPDKVNIYLRDLREFVLSNLDVFRDEESDGEAPATFIEFEVNVIVDNARTSEVPIIIETVPTYRNLFGTIEKMVYGPSEHPSDLSMIRAGALLRANGGFLVISLPDVFEEPGVWSALKRTLKNKKVSIQPTETITHGATSALKPEAIDIDLKLVLIGDSDSYHYFYNYDEDFRKIFKIKADFDTEMPNNQENLAKYGQFLRSLVDDEGLLHFDKSAVAACAEHGAEIAGRQDKLSTRFSDVADVAREACYWARKGSSKITMAEHVEQAIQERMRRVNLPEEKMTEMIVEGTILLDIDGRKVGQVNGLSVYDLGDYSFGKPVRITVETSVGRSGIINVEREAELSGKTYNKGSLILEGFLRSRFAQTRPLAMNASICFEQSYGGIDGDSASSTEIYGLMSSLSGLPLRQDLAVTGSVNQKGEVQPIGGVNQKVQGFFDICRVKGLTGKQGVIVPALNRVDLMLRKDVVQAIEQGRFHVFAVDDIDQGIELLTGVSAGRRRADETFEEGSVNDLIEKKLTRFSEQLKDEEDSDKEE